MEQVHVQRVERLAEYCPEGCKFHKLCVQNLCKAKDVGLETFVRCLEQEPIACDCSLFFADAWFCSCAPRVYIAKTLRK